MRETDNILVTFFQQLHITIRILDTVRIFILSLRFIEIIKMLCFDK